MRAQNEALSILLTAVLGSIGTFIEYIKQANSSETEKSVTTTKELSLACQKTKATMDNALRVNFETMWNDIHQAFPQKLR